MVDEGLGYAICFDKLVNISGNSSLCFRLLQPKLEVRMSVLWKNIKSFQKQHKNSCSNCRQHNKIILYQLSILFDFAI